MPYQDPGWIEITVEINDLFLFKLDLNQEDKHLSMAVGSSKT
jgi:hypothetical protein